MQTFYRGKRVLVTGHTGFKGAWLCRILQTLGAEVTGYALEPPTSPSLFELTGMAREMHSVLGDVRDYEHLYATFCNARPEIVFHLAAQPLVREGYRLPRDTYEANVMGTVNLLECVRQCASVRSVINVTTDKVYQNREWVWGYRENEPLDGYDPYSNSKSCAELVTHSYQNSFFRERGVAVSTARAGNVIGGGDFAPDRIVPDCVRAALAGRPIAVRNPHSVRPYQHVLEPLFAYLLMAMHQYEKPSLSGSYNVGPDEADCLTTGEIVALFVRLWGGGLTWFVREAEGPHEAGLLKLDASLLRATFGWRPRWSMEEAMRQVVAFTRVMASGGDIAAETDREIALFMGVLQKELDNVFSGKI